jgi:hypothetical protein
MTRTLAQLEGNDPVAECVLVNRGTGLAFGPVMDSRHADDFLDSLLKEPDQYSPDELGAMYLNFKARLAMIGTVDFIGASIRTAQGEH